MSNEIKKTKEEEFKGPECKKHKDCFANTEGRCDCLIDNDFGSKDCPFFKRRATNE